MPAQPFVDRLGRSPPWAQEKASNENENEKKEDEDENVCASVRDCNAVSVDVPRGSLEPAMASLVLLGGARLAQIGDQRGVSGGTCESECGLTGFALAVEIGASPY